MAPAPATVVAPTAVMAAAVAPAHLFGRKPIDLVAGGDRGMGISIAWLRRLLAGDRLRHQRRCLRTRGQRRGASGKPKSEFQKMAAFHDISSSRQC
jgi:hypothetical protein